MKTFKRVVTVLLILVMVMGLSTPFLAREIAGNSIDSPSHISDDLHHTQLYDRALYAAFELFRVQVALSVGMNYETFLHGDIGTWMDDYLYQWRRANGVTVVSYEGPMLVTLNPETGLNDVISAETHEVLYTLYRCDNEFDVVRKSAILRSPNVFYNRILEEAGVDSLSMLMYDVLGIDSIEALIEAVPDDVLELQMDMHDVSLDEIGTINNIEVRRDGLNLPPVYYTRVSNTTIQPYSSVVRTSQMFRYHNSPTGYVGGTATGFIVAPHLFMTAGHVVFDYHSRQGWVHRLEARPGARANSAPFGVGHIRTASVGSGWWLSGASQYDFALVAIHGTFAAPPIRVRPITSTYLLQGRIRAARVMGFPHRHFEYGRYMYTSRFVSVTHVYPYGHERRLFGINAPGGPGYSGAPVVCQYGYAVGLIIGTFGTNQNSPLVIAITPTLYNIIRSW